MEHFYSNSALGVKIKFFEFLTTKYLIFFVILKNFVNILFSNFYILWLFHERNLWLNANLFFKFDQKQPIRNLILNFQVFFLGVVPFTEDLFNTRVAFDFFSFIFSVGLFLVALRRIEDVLVVFSDFQYSSISISCDFVTFLWFWTWLEFIGYF